MRMINQRGSFLEGKNYARRQNIEEYLTLQGTFIEDSFESLKGLLSIYIALKLKILATNLFLEFNLQIKML